MGLLTNLAATYTTTRTSYGSSASSDATVAVVFAVVFGIFTFLFVVTTYVVESLFLMKLFKKANVAGWKAWVPFVNIWTFLQLGGQKGAWTFGAIGAIAAYLIIAILGVITAVVANASSSASMGGIAVTMAIVSVVLYIAAFAGVVLTTVFQCIAAYNIGKKLGFDPALVVLYIFIGIVWLGIAGLGKSKFDDSKGKPSLAPTVK
ncbi:hypothetical protein FACS189431_4660 [Alphaproteobacteria bacterium]|nr:hypothetical protein FACS189431_4660 [Alphaproteobacteria bacterium]